MAASIPLSSGFTNYGCSAWRRHSPTSNHRAVLTSLASRSASACSSSANRVESPFDLRRIRTNEGGFALTGQRLQEPAL